MCIRDRLFQVERLDFDGRKAYVRSVDCDYYTDAITYTKVTILDTFASDAASSSIADTRYSISDESSSEPQATSIEHRVSDIGHRTPTASPRSHGEVHVVSRVVGFKKIKFYTNENVGSGELELPEQQMHTTSYWLTIPASVMMQLPYTCLLYTSPSPRD